MRSTVARADLLINLVKAGASGEHELFERTVSAIIAEERSKHHHVLADALHHASQPTELNRSKHVQIAVKASCDELLLKRDALRSLSDLLLPDDVLLLVSQLIEEQQRADILRSYSLEPRSRILLTGPPGNGKTSLAEAIANCLAVPFFVVRYETIVNSYLGETAKRLNEVFQFAKLHHCVLFFDEFDALGKEREDQQESGEIKRVLNSLLVEFDRLPSYVVLVAATNHPGLLDRAVWRRFQIKASLPLPSETQIQQWFELVGRRFPHLQLPVTKQALSKLNGASFSELEDLTQDVLRRCVLEQSSDPQHLFAEQVRVWTNTQAVKESKHGKSAAPHFSPVRKGRKGSEDRARNRNSITNSSTSRGASRSTDPKTRTRVR